MFVHSNDGETHQLPRRALSIMNISMLREFSCGCRLVFLLLSKSVYQMLVRGRAVWDGFINEVGMTKEEGNLLWPRATISDLPSVRCLKNKESSLTWLVIQSPLWVSKKLFTACLIILPVCIHCGDMRESILHAFFYCPVLRPLQKLLDGYILSILNEKFFVLEASSVCSHVVTLLNRMEHCFSA